MTMLTLLQVSDPHFGTERPPVVQALRRFVRDLSPDVLVLSGDITQRATAAQFHAARRFVDSLQVPRKLVVPGNHDVPLFDLFARCVAPYARQARAFGDDMEPVIDMPGLLLLGVKTTRRWRHKNGEVSEAQIDRVAVRLAQRGSDRVGVVVVHHPVAVTLARDRPNLLRGHGAAVRRWAAAGADVILGGHIHLPYVLPLHEAESLARPVWAVQAGTALSRRVRPEVPVNSVNVLRCTASPRHCSVERWDCADSARGFERVQVHSLGLAAS